MANARGIALGCLMLALGGCSVRVQPVPRELAAPTHGASVSFHIEEEWLPSEKPSAQATRGQAAYAQACARCHGATGRPANATVRVDFSDPTWGRDRTPLELVQLLSTGRSAHGTHAAFADSLTLQQVYDAVAYVGFLSTTVEALRQTDRTLFGTHCNVCHGNKGFGNGFLAPTMQPKPRNLADFHAWGVHRSDTEIHDNIALGLHWSSMPPWRGVLSDEQIWQLVDFIRSMQCDPPSEAQPDGGAAGQGGA